MFCKNCGYQLEDGARFCPECGTPVSVEPSTPDQDISGSQQPVCPHCGSPVKPAAAFCRTCGARLASSDQTVSGASQPVPFPAPSKKRSKVPFVIAGVGAAVLLIGGVCAVNASSLNHFFRRTFSSPENYYQYTELAALKESSKAFSAPYQNFLDSLQGGMTADLSFCLEDTGRSLLSMVTPMDLSWFEELSMKASAWSDDTTEGSQAELYLNDNKLVTLKRAADLELQEMYMKIPELSGDYLGIALPDGISLDTSTNAFMGMQQILSSFPEFCPDSETLETLINRYGKLVIENINDVTKSKDTLTVSGVSQDCTLLEAKITDEDMARISDAVLSQLMEDKDVEDMIRAFARTAQTLPGAEEVPDEDTAYLEFTDEIQELQNSLAQSAQETSGSYMLSKIWVGSNGKVAGRSLTLGGDTYLEIFKYLMPEDGKDYAFTAICNTSDAPVTISGNGKQTASKRDGSFSVTVNSTPMITVDMEDYDRKEGRKGYLNGRFTFRPQPGMMQGADAFGGILTNYALLIEFESSKGSNRADFSLLSAESALFTVSLSLEQEASTKTDFPSSSDNVYNMENESDMAAYFAGADWENLLSTLEKSGVPSEYLTQLQESLQSLVSRSTYYFD